MAKLSKNIFVKLCEVAEARYEEESWNNPRKTLNEYIWDEVEKNIDEEVSRRTGAMQKEHEREKLDFTNGIEYLKSQLEAERKLHHCHCEIPLEVYDNNGRHCGHCGKTLD